MDKSIRYGFAEGPQFSGDLERVGFVGEALDALRTALQSLLLHGDYREISQPLGPDTDIRVLRTVEFPALNVPDSYLTFRFEKADLVELRRLVSAADLRAGFYADV